MARTKQSLDDIYGVKSDRPSAFRTPSGTVSDWISNRRYHNHFRGYTEIRRVDESGHVHIDRYYTSPWTVCELSERKYWGVRVIFILLALISAALYVFAMAQDVPGNSHWAIAIPGLPTVIFLIVLFVRIGFFCAAPRKMTLFEFESTSKKLRRTALFTMCIELVTGLALIVFALVTGVEVGRTIFSGLMVILAACAPAAVYFIERKLPYKEIPNDTVVPEGESFPIR